MCRWLGTGHLVTGHLDTANYALGLLGTHGKNVFQKKCFPKKKFYLPKKFFVSNKFFFFFFFFYQK